MTDSRLVYTSDSDGVHGEVVTVGHYPPDPLYQRDRQVFLVELNLLGDYAKDVTLAGPAGPCSYDHYSMEEQVDNRALGMLAELAKLATQHPYADTHANPWALRLTRSEVPGYATAIITYIDRTDVDNAINVIGRHLASNPAIINSVLVGSHRAAAYPMSQGEINEWHMYHQHLDWMDDL